ncbi:hypothetical protein Syun_029698 [Stephania yunnanensis]|uniref:Uncharacterized protein n=1 Tax=Stephania yunnanensis TaxID=152371 RepID=A0AAP0E621_9MAGN
MNVLAIHGGLLKPDVVEGTDDERVWRLPCWELTETSKRDDGIDLLKDNQALQRLTGTDDNAKMDLSSLTQTNIRQSTASIELKWQKRIVYRSLPLPLTNEAKEALASEASEAQAKRFYNGSSITRRSQISGSYKNTTKSQQQQNFIPISLTLLAETDIFRLYSVSNQKRNPFSVSDRISDDVLRDERIPSLFRF